MLKLIATLFFMALMSQAVVSAGDWPASAKQEIQAAGARLTAAKSPAERVAALRQLSHIASQYPDAEGARLLARTLAAKATQEAGPAAMISALETMAKADHITDAKTYGSIMAPLMSAVSDMRDEGSLLPSAAIELDNALNKLNAAAAKAGLPKIPDAIDQATGNTGLASKAANLLGKIAAVAKLARKAPNLADADSKETKTIVDTAVGLVPSELVPPAYVPFRDAVVWTKDLTHQATNGVQLVADGIGKGHVDGAAIKKVSDEIRRLAKHGPWGADTAKDFFKSLCKKIPIAGLWCDDAFKLAEKLFGPVDCGKINCDCQNVSGGIIRGPLIVQCKLQEADLISACKAQKKITGSCGDASGPAAYPK